MNAQVTTPSAESAKPSRTGSSPPKGPRPSGKGKTLRDFHEEDRLGKTYDTRLLKRLWPFMKPHAAYFYASISMIFVAAGLNLARPVVMGKVVGGAQSSEPGALMKHGMTLALVVVAMQLLTFLQTYSMQI
ncbi:MAG TPA: hypothetical protein VM580_17480, partial [Labilithrix sp.]|nr:hypothetical protein [Labilithrix sp.]